MSEPRSNESSSSEPRWSGPLRSSLVEPSDDAALARVRGRVMARLSTGPSSRWLGGREIAGFPTRALAVALVVMLLCGGVWLARLAGESGRLLTEAGAEFTRLDGEKGRASVEFADGSRLVAARGASVVGLASTSSEFTVLLERGFVDIAVTPGGPRRWVVEAKWARVEVVGTRFSVERRLEGDRERVVVRVREGVVVVRGASLPEGVARVTAGESVEVTERGEGSAGRDASLGPGPDRAVNDPEDRTEEARSVEAHLDERTSPIEPKSAATGRAVSSAPKPVESADRLFERADEARARGESAAAARLLERIVSEHSAHPRAALAAYTLGVVRVREGRSSDAVRAFERALQLAPSRSLREDTLLRLVEIEFARGARERGLERAREYRAWFPGGRHLVAIERLERERETP